MFIFKETGARNGPGSGIRLVDLVALALHTDQCLPMYTLYTNVRLYTNVHQLCIICFCKVQVSF